MAAGAIATSNDWLDSEDWIWPSENVRAELAPAAWIPTVPRPILVPEPVQDAETLAVLDPTAAVALQPRSLPVVLSVAAPALQTLPAPASIARRFEITPHAEAVTRPRRRRRSRGRLYTQRLLACAALAGVFVATFAAAGLLRASHHVTVPVTAATAWATSVTGATAAVAAASSNVAFAASDPVFISLTHTAGGSTMGTVRFVSAALGRPATFVVYLPPGYTAAPRTRYPVLYLLHGDGQLASAFGPVGLTSTLDTIISNGEITPLIAVMLNGGTHTDNWRNDGSVLYENYVLEAQQIVDHLLPTVASRGGRAIAGFSMGGFGAMNIALGHLDRFSVVESWLGFFNNLGPELKADAPALAHEPLTAFVYGASGDRIADPSENAPFAAQLRAAGATAGSAVYSGGHDFATLRLHIRHMLVLAGHALKTSP